MNSTIFLYLRHLLLASSNKVICLYWWWYSNWMIILAISNCAWIMMVLLLSLNLFRSWTWSLWSYSTSSTIYLFFLSACTTSIHVSWSMTASRMTDNSLISVWTRSTILFGVFSCRLTCLALISIFCILILMLLNNLTILIFY